MNDIAELKDIVRRLHGSDSTHVASVPVREKFQGRTVWDGIVEVVDLQGHPLASRAYVWSHETEDVHRPKRHIAVLHAGPVTSAAGAVRAAIVYDFTNAETAEEI